MGQAQYRIEEEDQLALQYNIIRSHSSGMGAYFSPEVVKSAILCRLNTLSLGRSGGASFPDIPDERTH